MSVHCIRAALRGRGPIIRLALVAVLVTVFAPRIAWAQTYPGKVGINLEGIGNRAMEFVDVAKTTRSFSAVGGGSVGKDSAGWPTADAQTVLFDMRPVAAWAGSIDDPAQYQIDVTGTYKMSFKGQGDVNVVEGSVSVANKLYNSSSNTTTADLVVSGPIAVISFTNTRRTSAHGLNTGFTDLRVTRPGYAHNTTQVFHTPFLDCLNSAAFSTIRFMDWTHTNQNNPSHPTRVGWSERPTVGNDATWDDEVKWKGAPWEYCVLLANASNKDMWINVPVAANDDYITKLAQLIRYGSDGVNPYTTTVTNPVYPPLNSNLNVWVEYSNEIWNWAFWQAGWNNSEAQVNGLSYITQYAKRTVEISNLFKNVFGASAINSRVRVANCWQIGWNPPDYQYNEQMNYINTNYGPPSNFIYALGVAPYFGESPTAGETVDTILSQMQSSSDNSATKRATVKGVADTWNIPGGLVAYEGGADNGGGSTVNIANRILANRDPRMGDLIERDLRTNWFGVGGGLFNYFTMTSGYNRYGSWGLTDDATNPDRNSKFQAIRNVVGAGSLPAGWISQDIGSPSPAGSAGASAGTWTVKGGGTDIWSTADQFHYAYTDAAGDMTVIAQATSITNTHAWAKAGVMVRDGMAANAKFAMVVITPGSGASFQYRNTTGGSVVSTTLAGYTVNEWLKLVRSGSSFTAFRSNDGSNWQQIGTAVTVSMPSSVKAGLCVTSHSNGTLCTTTFTDVSIASNGPSTYEGENGTFDSGSYISTYYPGYSGTGFIDYGGSGSYVEWTNVNRASAGAVNLAFRYANGSSANRTCNVTVNGVQVGTVSFAPTGWWDVWSTTTLSNINLNAGNSTIRVTASTTNGGPNFDKMDVSTGTSQQVAAPSFSPSAGSYSSSQSVTISTATSGASIRYTVNGSTPTSTTGTLYSGAVSINQTTTLKAIAFKSGMSNSNVTSGTYTITTPLTYQAEDATLGGTTYVATHVAGYTGTGFADYGGLDNYVEFTNVNRNAGGTVTLTFRYGNGSTVNRSCDVIVNGANVGTVNFAPTGAWSTWSTETIDVALSAGSNTIRVNADTSSGGPNLDKMDVGD